MPISKTLRGAGAIAFWLGTSLAAAARGEAIRLPAAGARLETETRQTVAWSFARFSLPPGSDEMELLLSLDGGQTFPLRVTASIDPDDREWSWRVPALPTRRARLLLRAGAGERRDAETPIAISEEFEIFSSGTLPLEELFAVDGQWRTREALESSAPRRFVDPDLDAGESLVPGTHDVQAAEPGSTLNAEGRPQSLQPLSPLSLVQEARQTRNPLPRFARPVPLRL